MPAAPLRKRKNGACASLPTAWPKHNEGQYILIVFNAKADTVKELERRLRVSDMVIKFLTVRIDEKLKRIEKRKKAREKRAARKPAPQPQQAAMPALFAGRTACGCARCSRAAMPAPPASRSTGSACRPPPTEGTATPSNRRSGESIMAEQRSGGRPIAASQRPTGGDKAIATGKKQYFRRKKVCRFCVDKVDDINYKDVKTLMSFVSERGKITPRRISGVCTPHQKRLSEAIKQARNIALVPFASRM